MPYSTEDYTPPSMPEIPVLRSFEDVRSAVGKIVEYLQRVQAHHVQYFTRLTHNLNHSAVTQGPDIRAATTIQVSHFMHVITGPPGDAPTPIIGTIHPPMNFVGQLMLFSQNGFYLDDTPPSNLSLLQTPNYVEPGAHIMLTWVPSKNKWFADTCRLKT